MAAYIATTSFAVAEQGIVDLAGTTVRVFVKDHIYYLTAKQARKLPFKRVGDAVEQATAAPGEKRVRA